MKVLKFVALGISAMGLGFGVTSCSSTECCTYDGEEICEDDDLEGYSWEDIKSVVSLLGGTCD